MSEIRCRQCNLLMSTVSEDDWQDECNDKEAESGMYYLCGYTDCSAPINCHGCPFHEDDVECNDEKDDGDLLFYVDDPVSCWGGWCRIEGMYSDYCPLEDEDE